MKCVQSQHSVYRLSYHIVWVCKYRRRVLKPGVVEYIKKILPKLLRSIGLDEEKIKHYVEYQGRLDLGQLRLELEGKGT